MQNWEKSVVPHLATAMSGPLADLERHLLLQQVSIEAWFRQQWLLTPPAFTASVDLRNAGFKLAPVDTNLFPAGFNNLPESFMPLCVHATQSYFSLHYPNAHNIILVPERHTRNIHYFVSLAKLRNILQASGLEVRIGTLLETITKPESFDLPSGDSLTLEPLTRHDNRLSCGDFVADVVLLNNDLSEGKPDILLDLQQDIVPPLGMGWYQRLKSQHFTHYQQICDEFSEILGLDSWCLHPLFRNCGDVDFMSREGEDCLEYNADLLLKTIQRKYDAFGIKEKPFVIVKADAGTYGMGVMTLRSPEEIKQLNRKQRTRMMKSKGAQPITQILVQEGVYTFETVGDEKSVAEPVVYMLGQHVVGGFYRVHTNRGIDENLNAPGMHFEPLAFASACAYAKPDCAPKDCTNRFYAYGVVARLALLAAAREKSQLLES